MARANCFLVVPEDADRLPAGQPYAFCFPEERRRLSQICGCPTLAAFLFLPLGWETLNRRASWPNPKRNALSHFTASGPRRHGRRQQQAAHSPHRIRVCLRRAFPGGPLRSAKNPKGNPLEVARFAGIQAAKRTADLIPMCHPLALTHVDVQAAIVRGGVRITSTVSTTGPTGVEMEALTAASIAALTVYDMTKALDKAIVIRDIRVESKSGGKSGDFFTKRNKARLLARVIIAPS